jgi:hypothetical protein
VPFHSHRFGDSQANYTQWDWEGFKTTHVYGRAVKLLPAYKQRLKRDVPVVRSVERWSESKFTFQDCFDHMDWNIFRVASGDNVNEYVDSVTGFIKKCIDDTIPIVSFKHTLIKNRGLTADL